MTFFPQAATDSWDIKITYFELTLTLYFSVHKIELSIESYVIINFT